ncbi:OmpR/PhoB-type DNA-binding domain containing protein [uncultured Caudovirales phage]|uniref:OmpR/PhoB-type DNA-binding domain containing protein n=1 Tax=uncultured Caudovirales phage TaxID=2100421 RepID=A0A6J5L0Y6_9CAUD|nr:OmpR/PhoB-type DNA-binding domain containing protein [uncultured Caudovirales phage]
MGQGRQRQQSQPQRILALLEQAGPAGMSSEALLLALYADREEPDDAEAVLQTQVFRLRAWLREHRPGHVIVAPARSCYALVPADQAPVLDAEYLPPQQAALLARLRRAGGKVVPHAELIGAMGGRDHATPASNSVMKIMIHRLRRRGHQIGLVWGVGYLLAGETRADDGAPGGGAFSPHAVDPAAHLLQPHQQGQHVAQQHQAQQGQENAVEQRGASPVARQSVSGSRVRHDREQTTGGRA